MKEGAPAVGLDTSVVMRLLVGSPVPQAEAALRFLRRCQASGTDVLISDSVLAEAYYSLQHHYAINKGEALAALKAFLGWPGIINPGGAGEILELAGLGTAKPGFVDRLVHANYLALGARELITFERAARKLSHAHVLTA